VVAASPGFGVPRQRMSGALMTRTFMPLKSANTSGPFPSCPYCRRKAPAGKSRTGRAFGESVSDIDGNDSRTESGVQALYTDEVNSICEAAETVDGETPGAVLMLDDLTLEQILDMIVAIATIHGTLTTLSRSSRSRSTVFASRPM
jgi:hypothetical protein